MAINDLPVLSVLRTRMQWHQERQRVLAENVSNSDTPNFKPRDLVEPKFNSRRRHGGGSMGAADVAHQQRPYCAVRRPELRAKPKRGLKPGRPATRSISKTR